MKAERKRAEARRAKPGAWSKSAEEDNADLLSGLTFSVVSALFA